MTGTDLATAPMPSIRERSPIVIDGVRVDLLGELRIAVLALERVCPSQPSLNRDGWKSKEIFSWPGSCASDLSATIVEHVARELARPFFLHGWAMVNRPGSYHPRHVHQGALMSGVYCVDPGDEPSSPTVFEGTGGDIAVIPAPGRLVLFPGDLWHRVDACGGSRDRPRITIAFDARR